MANLANVTFRNRAKAETAFARLSFGRPRWYLLRLAMGADGSDERPSETLRGAGGEPGRERLVRSAWRTWLSALATDADAAMAAALAYESLPPESRDAWLDALAHDRSMLDVPAVALYAPLLAVESDGGRRERIAVAIAAENVTDAADESAEPSLAPSAFAFRGVNNEGVHACVLVAPVYLNFVQVLRCRYTPHGGFLDVRHDPLKNAADLPRVRELDGVVVEPTPLRIVVEELAHAILADRRAERESPQALASFAHLFGPDFDDLGGGA
jgi:hypothetical protein